MQILDTALMSRSAAAQLQLDRSQMWHWSSILLAFCTKIHPYAMILKYCPQSRQYEDLWLLWSMLNAEFRSCIKDQSSVRWVGGKSHSIWVYFQHLDFFESWRIFSKCQPFWNSMSSVFDRLFQYFSLASLLFKCHRLLLTCSVVSLELSYKNEYLQLTLQKNQRQTNQTSLQNSADAIAIVKLWMSHPRVMSVKNTYWINSHMT